MAIRNRNLHTISYGKNDSDLYAEVNRLSQLNLVPIATLIKGYVRKGLNQNQQELSISKGEEE